MFRSRTIYLAAALLVLLLMGAELLACDLTCHSNCGLADNGCGSCLCCCTHVVVSPPPVILKPETAEAFIALPPHAPASIDIVRIYHPPKA